MKKLIYLLLTPAVFAITGTACQKCYTCTQELPFAINSPASGPNGITVDSSTITREFCAGPIEARLEIFEMEDDGFTCVKQ
ncbi:MAG: hypothetical protein Salg2KO_03270 [Salibacteraceae bacterium]